MKNTVLFICLIIIPFTVLTTCCIAQENWPEFRGPTADGLAPDAVLPIKFDEDAIRWETEIHGKGWSSPVIWDRQIWLTTATPDGTKMSVLAVNLESGEVEQDKVLFENDDPAFCHDMNSYATPTPAIENGRIYMHFGKYGTTCLDTASGEKIWERRDLECNHHRGPASSPILFEDLMIVAFDGFDVQYVVALNKQTGETVWKTDREIDYGTDNGDQMKAYCTGAIINVNDEPILVYPSAVATIAYNPRDGKAIWTAYHGGMNASARPITTPDGLVVITNGMGQMVGVRPDGTGDVTETHVAWKSAESVAKKSSQLVANGMIYMISDKGVISCVDPLTGKPIFRERVNGSFAASPILADGKIYFFGTEGSIYVIEAKQEYALIAEAVLGDGFMASPAVAGDRLILRSKSKLYCLQN